MKKLLIGIMVLVLGIGGYIVYRVQGSRPLSPPRTTAYSYNGLDIKVVYCSPSKRGRLIFGDSSAAALVPNGKYWRLGANEATEITFSKDISIDGKLLKAGSYRMYAVPRESTWEISFNSELGKWGFNEPDYSKDVLKINVPVEKVSKETEQFTVSFSSDPTSLSMNIDWDKRHLRVPITVN